MKIEVNKNMNNLLANNASTNIIVTLDLNTSVENNSINDSEPMHYCFLLDISKSTREDNGFTTQESNVSNNFNKMKKKERIKATLESFIKDTLTLFRDEDKISIVAYDEDVYNVFNGMTKNDSQTMSNRIDLLLKQDLQSDYNNITKALKMGTRVLEYHNYNKNKIIVITDTNPSFCQNDFGQLVDTEENMLNETKNIASKNIAMDCICLGSIEDIEQVNYDFAYKLVQATNGKAYTIEEPELIKMHLADSIRDSHNSSRYNGKITLIFNEGVTVGDYYSISPDNKYFGKMKIQEPNESIGYRHCIIELPELKDNTIYNYMMEVNIPTVITKEEIQSPKYRGAKPFGAISVKVEYETIENGKLEKLQEKTMIGVDITEDIILVQQGINAKINRYYKMATIKKLEGIFIKANQEQDAKVLHDSGSKMCKIYEELGMYREAMDIKQYFRKAMQGIQLRPIELNTMVKTSSTARIIEPPKRQKPKFNILREN